MIRVTGALIACLVWGALSFGAVYPWGYWPLAATSLTCASAGLLLQRNIRTAAMGRALKDGRRITEVMGADYEHMLKR